MVKNGIICIDNTNGNLLNSYTITTGLNPLNLTFQWFNDQGQVISTNSTYQATVAGNYSLIVTNTITGCASDEVFINVKESESAIINIEVNDDFSNNQTLTINASGIGDYEYLLDEGEYQDSPIFENVFSGEHQITVRDKNGCGLTTTASIIINYPKYFTPNADGVNDTWNIKDLENQTDSKITILDRYGKFITLIKANEQGWDGNLNNSQLPSDDYWFTVSYNKNGEVKEFKSHFTLKR
jgi:gliding motility-associated-like protein